jgi:hypothetical protein
LKEFREHQRFTKWWVWLPILALLLFFIYSALQQIVLGKPVGENPMSNIALAGTLVLILAVVITLMVLQLTTKVNEQGIFANFSLFGKHQFLWADVKNVRLVNMGMVGYGYRVSKNHGTVFNLGGKKGLEINLKSNKRYTVVVEKEEALRKTLKTLKKI